MKKVLIFCLSAALLLVSLTACHKPQADQPTEPDPPQTVTTTQADVSTPEPLADPKPEPPEQAPASPDQLSDTIPAAPDEVEDTQPPEETESQEDEVQLFTDVNETVYATGTVNLRSGRSVIIGFQESQSYQRFAGRQQEVLSIIIKKQKANLNILPYLVRSSVLLLRHNS